MAQIITLIFLILFSLLTYLKIMNLTGLSIIKKICGIVFSVALALGTFSLRTPLPYLRFVFMVLALWIFMGLITKIRLDVALTGMMISLAVTSGAAVICAVISAGISFIALGYVDGLLLITLSFSIASTILYILFKITRHKKGMPFLKKRVSGIFGSFISGIILLGFMLAINENISNEIRTTFIIVTILCVALLIFWWRHSLMKQLREGMWENTIREHDQTIKEKDGQICRLQERVRLLQEDNERLDRINHRDNEVLGGLILTTEALFKQETAHMEDAKDLLKRLKQQRDARNSPGDDALLNGKVLPSTNNAALDGLMRHMMIVASGKGVQFDLTVNANISGQLGLSAIDLETLCAALIGNAIIAASHNQDKRVLATIGTNGGFLELNVQDTGIPFQRRTLELLGKSNDASTYLGKGGSGNGYMDVFGILQKYKASLIITEYRPRPNAFTKSVRIRFDGKGEYIVHNP
jgi:hypothetical protein